MYGHPFFRWLWGTVCLTLIIALCLISCKTTRKAVAITPNPIPETYHASYDDSTLHQTELPVLMPYNKIIDPAGEVIRFGDPALENHTLSCALSDDKQWLAVTDRYGLVFINPNTFTIQYRLAFRDNPQTRNLVSTFSGISWYTHNDSSFVFCSGVDSQTDSSLVWQIHWNGHQAQRVRSFHFPAQSPAPMALPNDVEVVQSEGKDYLLVVLNGNNTLAKIDLATGKKVWEMPTGMLPFGVAVKGHKAYVTNWGGIAPDAGDPDVAGAPWGNIRIDPATGAAASGSVSVMAIDDGHLIKEIPVGLHPNDILLNQEETFAFVANGNSDQVTVIDTRTDAVTETIPVKLFRQEQTYFGDTPNALALSHDGQTLFVANGMDNAVAVVSLGRNVSPLAAAQSSRILGFIPTEAYPSGLALGANEKLYVTNLEAEGARAPIHDTTDAVLRKFYEKNPQSVTGFYNSHHQLASVSEIPLPHADLLGEYTEKVEQMNLAFRIEQTYLPPRKNVLPQPVPERIGEPSVFRHVVYIIKENRTYDQILGDMPEGDGYPELCTFGETVTPNSHKIAREFLLLDNYYVSGKSSAEGHQWTDAAITTDYVEKSVRAWFRSYPHVQTDAMVYSPTGFIWNHALDHGKTVRIYGEASFPRWDTGEKWEDIYRLYTQNKTMQFTNETTISRVKPILSTLYPAYDSHNFPDVYRARAFIEELKTYEQQPGDQWPELMVVALPNDHTAGMNPNFPTPRAMVADNDLALGQIVEAISKSRFWNNTVIFVTEDDSQAGWDHVSAYRTTGYVISPYSRLQTTIRTNYNQTSMVRTIEQILGIPPMHMIDASALPMFDCFSLQAKPGRFRAEKNQVPLDEMNKGLSELKGKARQLARQSMSPKFDHIDSGHDDELNRIIWYATRGDQRYPVQYTDPDAEDDDDDEGER